MKIRAILLAMAANEIKQMIPPYLFEDIKRRDPKPLFRAYVVGQEGEATPKLVGVGKIALTWFTDAVGKLSRKIWSGMKIFNEHGETNSHEGRDPIGEVAGSRTKMIDGKFSAVIAAYIFPEFKDLPLDIASIEAVITMDNQIDSDIRAPNVEDVTGIALGSSAINKPGFAGATMIGTLQAFAEEIQSNKGVKMDKSEIIEALKAAHLGPSDVFSNDVLITDTFVAGYIKESNKTASVEEYARRKKAEDKIETLKTEHETESKKIKDENATLKSENAGPKAADLFKDKYAERKLTVKQIEFIEAKREKFKVSDPEKISKEVDDFMDEKVTDFKENMELLGIKDESKTPTPGSEENKEDELTGEDDDLGPPV